MANPGATIVERGASVWVVSGDPTPDVRSEIEADGDFESVRRLLSAAPGEYSFVHVDGDGSVRAHRGITSGHEVFYLRASDGTRVVTDQFKNAIANLDVDDRTVTEEVVADHLLYRTTPVGSYIAEVGRLGHGETLSWNSPDGIPVTELRETLSRRPDRDVESATDDLDEALRSLSPSGDDPRLMLSGGVDSTLLGTYLDRDTATESGAYDSPELEFEVEYARSASRLLGTDHRVFTASEEDFVSHLESTIDAAAMPLQQIQTPMHDLVFRHGDANGYVSGFLADSLFGMGAGAAKLVWLTRPLRFLPPLVPKLASHREIARELLRPPTSPRGYAAQTVQYQPMDLVSSMVGSGLVERRQRVRTGYVRDRVPLPLARADLSTHLAWGQWIEYFCENSTTSIRQVAQARGRSLEFPFAGSAVADVALSMPSPERYLDRFTGKHLTKRLLERRLPSYDPEKPKGNGHPPESRFFSDGPLASVFDRYPMPAFVPDDLRRGLAERSPGMAWILASFAIWRDRVLERDDVEPVANTRTVEV